MDLTKLASIAKFKVGEVVMHMRRPHRITGRFWSKSRQHIVYDLELIDTDRKSTMKKIGEGLVEPMPASGHVDASYYDELPGDW